MSDQQPPPWFGKQESPAEDPDFEKRKKQFLAELPKLQEGRKRGRAQSFYPYLLVRSVLGDRGDRPINVPFWESPDIWTTAGAPGTTPAIPASHGGVVTAGKPHTLYAHVWNLGFAPLAGVLVEFYWFNPSLGIDGSHANVIGQARCELASRGMQGSHQLVKCPTAWTPVMENGGHECLVVRVSGMGDAIGANEWAPWLNRHVAQRNVSVLAAAQSTAGNLIKALEGSRIADGHLQLLQIGAAQGAMAARIVAPGKRVTPALHTKLLGELGPDKKVVLNVPAHVPPGMLAPVHELAHGGIPSPPSLRTPGTAIVDVHTALGVRAGTPAATVGGLLGSVPRLHPNLKPLGKPPAGEVHVLRLASYDAKGQLVGGYTIVLS